VTRRRLHPVDAQALIALGLILAATILAILTTEALNP
jgi:hypothetical protein